MKRTLVSLLAFVGVAALVFAGWRAWGVRPWRTAVDVNGRVLSAGELAQRAQLLLDDAARNEHIVMPESRKAEALAHYARSAAKLWIFKEVLLGAAVAHDVKLTPADETNELAKAEKRLRTKRMTLDEYFRTGPLPEEAKRRDFREALVVTKFLDVETQKRMRAPTEKEIEERHAELRRIQLARTRPGGKPPFKATRKQAIETLRMEAYDLALREIFGEQFSKTTIKCPAFPDLATFEALAPARPSRAKMRFERKMEQMAEKQAGK